MKRTFGIIGKYLDVYIELSIGEMHQRMLPFFVYMLSSKNGTGMDVLLDIS